MSRTYNIETMRLKEQRPWLFGLIALILCVLALVAVLFERSRRTGKRLERIVNERTHELEMQTSMLTTIFNSSPDFIFCKDLDLCYTQVNKSMQNFMGIHLDDFLGKNDMEIFGFSPKIAERYIRADREVIKNCQPVAFEEVIVSQAEGGIKVIVETIKVPLLQDGKVTGIMGISRDITKRKETENQLTMQTARLQAILGSLPDIVFCKDLALRYTQCNRITEEHNGVNEGDLIGKNDLETKIFPVEVAERIMEVDRFTIREGKKVINEETLPYYNGITRVMETVRSPLVQDGAIAGLIVIARDITKRKEIERELALQTAMLTTLFDTIPDLIFAKDLEFRYMQCNKSFLEHLGFLKENIIGKDDLDGLHLDPKLVDGYREWDRKVMKENRRVMLEERIPGADGTNPLYETVKAPLVLGGEVIGLLGISHDITTRKEMEETALSASRSKSVFLANMSHEIRTPMNSIMGFSELALDGEVSPKTRDYLSKIQTNADWLLQIINDILDISKIESGKMELENIPFDIHELFTSCRTLIIPKAAEKGIDLLFYAEPSIGMVPLGDPTRLRQVLVNLLSNAIKFTIVGAVKVLAEITEKTDNTVTIYFEIKDSGIGMTSDQIEKIFDPFTQAETGTTRQYGGTGLGLTITKNIVELMGGKLMVESVVGIGSKFSFTITFDMIKADNEEIISRKAALKEIEKPVFEGEVLLCEDNDMNQQVIREHLARVGLKTVIADNGKIGVEMVKNRLEKGEKQFDLILMDMHMPVMDGLEASAKILKLGAGIPIIAMTANIMSSDLDIYRRSGMSDCVGKPFTSQELWRCLLKYLKPVNKENAAQKNAQKEGPIDYDLEFKKSLQRSFLRNNQDKFKDIMTAIDSGDIKLAHRMVHTVKGNAGQIGKTALQKAAAAVELNLKDEKNLVTGEQLALLKKELDAALAELAIEIGSLDEKPANQPPVQTLDAQAARELLEKLEPMLKMGNPECRNFLNSLRGIAGSGELVRQIEDFEFEAALSLLEDLKKKL
jgi:PAS domain S-box-containing protein